MPNARPAEFDLQADGVWGTENSTEAYRWIPPTADYEPISPWLGNGRFDDGRTPTLYVGLTAEGALAEYFRRHPELTQFQSRLKLRLFRIRISAVREGLDVSVERLAAAVGIAWERLTSSDISRKRRYRRCQELAVAVIDDNGISIRCPSAAYERSTCLVLFGENTDDWTAEVDSEIELPLIDPDLVRPLPQGADI